MDHCKVFNFDYFTIVRTSKKTLCKSNFNYTLRLTMNCFTFLFQYFNHIVFKIENTEKKIEKS